MRISSFKLAALGLVSLAAMATTAAAQPPAPAPAAPNPLVSAAPTYISIPMEIAVNKSAKDTWARVGKFCDLGEWLQVACTISSGKDGEFGAVRSIANGAVIEVLVGKTDLSYTYTQPVRAGRLAYNLYHGTLEVKPVTATTSKLVYTLFYDNSMLADDAARQRDIAGKTAQFQGALKNMKTLAEGGTLPPPAPRPAAPAAAPAAR
jgi:hypothetical protein